MKNINRHKKFKYLNFLVIVTFLSTCLLNAGGSSRKFLRDNDSIQYVANENDYNIVVAALKGDYTIVEGLLEKGISPNSMLEDGTTPLIYAAQSGSLLICKLLVAKGATINYKPASGHTALIAAIKGNYSQIVEFLIEKGANINLTDDLGRTAFIYSVSIGDSVMCEKLLALNADLNVKDNAGIDALMTAIINHRLNIATDLLIKGANAKTYDTDGVTPLMVATGNSDYPAIELLLKYGADINHKSRHKESALTIAIENNDESMLQYLIKKGADVNQRLTLAETPLTIAYYHKIDNFIIEALEEHGARQNAFPDFRRITFGPEITFNFDDFMGGFNIGTKEYKYNLDINGGIIFRPFATRVLIPDTGTAFYQYWERRNFVYLGIDKSIKLARHDSKTLWGLILGLNELYTFGTYRGTVLTAGNRFLLVPEGGFYYSFSGIQFSLIYQYMNFDRTGVSPGRINFSTRFILGSKTVFNKNSYRPWD
jgi:ankyrin repeat protein